MPPDERESESEPTEAGRSHIGSRLAAMRRERGMTGQEVGASAGMSQAKISKIETGAVQPTPRDVEAIARALDASTHVVKALRTQAESLTEGFSDWRVDLRRLAGHQQKYGAYEHRANVIRAFQPALVPGLLQTAEYARTVLGDYSSVTPLPAEHEPTAVPPAVSARIQRQEVLYDTTKKFIFILAETVFLHRICSAPVWVAQIHRIRTVSDFENVTVGILPTTASLTFPPIQGFDIYDDRMVAAEMVSTVVTSRGKKEIAAYRTVFESFFERAEFDLPPILDRYLSMYADIAHPAPVS